MAVNHSEVARRVVESSPKWPEIEDDVSLCDYVRRTQGVDLTLIDAETVRAEMDDEDETRLLQEEADQD